MSQNNGFTMPFSIKLGNNFNLNLDSNDVMKFMSATKKAKEGLSNLKSNF